jgi:hypothetical protein
MDPSKSFTKAYEGHKCLFYSCNITEYRVQQPPDVANLHYQFAHPLFILFVVPRNWVTCDGIGGVVAPRLSYDVVNLVARVAHSCDSRHYLVLLATHLPHMQLRVLPDIYGAFLWH